MKIHVREDQSSVSFSVFEFSNSKKPLYSVAVLKHSPDYFSETPQKIYVTVFKNKRFSFTDKREKNNSEFMK